MINIQSYTFYDRLEHIPRDTASKCLYSNLISLSLIFMNLPVRKCLLKSSPELLTRIFCALLPYLLAWLVYGLWPISSSRHFSHSSSYVHCHVGLGHSSVSLPPVSCPPASWSAAYETFGFFTGNCAHADKSVLVVNDFRV